jgi:predicted nuclease of predicted toxin-antitoxin system
MRFLIDAQLPPSLARWLGERVVWLRIGNSTNPDLFQWLESLWSRIVAQLDEGQHVVEARR